MVVEERGTIAGVLELIESEQIAGCSDAVAAVEAATVVVVESEAPVVAVVDFEQIVGYFGAQVLAGIAAVAVASPIHPYSAGSSV